MHTIDLIGQWEIIERPLDDGPDARPEVEESPAGLTGAVPGDLNDALVQAGRMPEPLEGRNFEQFGWVQQRSWWFRKTFQIPREVADREQVELVLDGLDVHADVWLNGVHLGHHRSAFYPFEAEVSGQLQADRDNVLLVRLTTGRERVPEEPNFPLLGAVPTEEGRGYPERGFQGRIYLRKPAYVWGWDWAPCLPTCGITGGAELRVPEKAEIRDVHLWTESIEDGTARVGACIELEWLTLVGSAYADVELVLTAGDGRTHRVRREEVFVAGGINRIELELDVPQANLWWPNGSGEQHLYDVRMRADVGDHVAESAPRKFGIRTLELDTSPGHFRFVINGEPVFMKGGNWIPCDSLYGRITAGKVTRLVEEAAEANFNCLRIWGGGRFEMDAFYDACDRLGILVWQDFMSACAPLPAHEEWFVEEFRREAQYQIRRLRSRPCLLLWCGNNEVGGMYGWFGDRFAGQKDPGWNLYHRLLPRLVDDLCPHLPYWPTSPYGGEESTDSPTVGDDHHWVVMRPDKEFWSDPFYWDSPEIPIFNSEYGYGGPCCIESTRQYLGTDEPNLFDETGRRHTNSFYDIPRVNWSIREHYRDPSNLPLEDYILLGGLCQGLNLGYSLESLRANHQTMGGIFWMYDDAWGENGWTIIDYYLRRKIAYYRVKRSLAPRRLVLRRGGQAFGGSANEVVLLGLNDSAEKLTGRLRMGYVRFDGSDRNMTEVAFSVPPRSKTRLATVPVPEEEARPAGTIMAIPDDTEALDPVVWEHSYFRELSLPAPQVEVTHAREVGDDLELSLCCDVFAHAVHLPLPGDDRLSDHYFNLLPGVEKTVCVREGAGVDVSGLRPRSVLPPEE